MPLSDCVVNNSQLLPLQISSVELICDLLEILNLNPEYYYLKKDQTAAGGKQVNRFIYKDRRGTGGCADDSEGCVQTIQMNYW